MSNITTIGIVLLLILLALANPLGLWMPHILMNLSVAMLAVAALAFAFAAHEKKEQDEGGETPSVRSGYFAGVALLIIGIVYTTLANDPLDIWLILALGGMVIARLISGMAPRTSSRRTIGATGWIALAALLVVVIGAGYYNLRPRPDVLVGRGKDVMLEGAHIVNQGTELVKDGAAIVEEGQILWAAGTSTPAQ